MFVFKKMNKTWLLVILYFLNFLFPHSSDATQENDFSRLSFAIHRSDNDISIEPNLSGKKVPLPTCVQKVIRKITEKEYQLLKDGKDETDKELEESRRTGSLYGPTYFITAPEGRSLFVFELRPYQQFIFILYDPRTNKCTENPEGVGERWGDITEVNGGGYIEKPLIRFEDINGSGNKDLAVQEVEHNGTCSTADVYLYYLIGKDLSLTTDLAIQTHADVCNENDSQINRAIQVKKKNYLQIGVLKYNTVTGINKNLGYFEVVKKDPNQPYQMLKVTPTSDYSNSPWFLLSIMASETGTDLNRLVTVGY
jgi:hypothetical protein